MTPDCKASCLTMEDPEIFEPPRGKTINVVSE